MTVLIIWHNDKLTIVTIVLFIRIFQKHKLDKYLLSATLLA